MSILSFVICAQGQFKGIKVVYRTFKFTFLVVSFAALVIRSLLGNVSVTTAIGQQLQFFSLVRRSQLPIWLVSRHHVMTFS